MTEEEKIQNNINSDDVWYEVIDGQQRLTTFFIILKSLKDALEILGLPTECYELKYQRDTSDISTTEFLNNIEGITQVDSTYIDFFYISSSFLIVKRWFMENKVNKGDFCNALLKYEPDENNTERDKANNVRFIWYESVDEDPIKVFTRLNIGKITLTNAELIKALFLNRSNFKLKDDNHLKLRQQEIASEWDNIEYTLQNDEFWLFLNDKRYKHPTRIDSIFELICHDKKQTELVGTDEYKTFRYYYDYFKQKESNIEVCWKEVKDYFQIFMEWYNDLELYHYVGFLVEYKYKLYDLLRAWKWMDDKNSFVKYLKGEIQKVIIREFKLSETQFNTEKYHSPLEEALDFQYKEEGEDKGKCKPILLFHNIQTIINQNTNNLKNKKYQIGMFYKFPFHIYKLENWDVEHINSNTTNQEDDEATRNEWLKNVFLGASDDIQASIMTYFNVSNESNKKEELFNKIKSAFPENETWTQEEKNRLWNYALLDSSTNRSYGNSIFSGKRRIVIGKDKGKLIAIPEISDDGMLVIGEDTDAKSSFVPPCTKLVFMKYYSVALNDANYWTKDVDAKGYLNDIEVCIKKLEN